MFVVYICALFSESMSEIFEQLDFVENPLYERIINDLLENKYSVVEDFFSADLVAN